MHASNNSGPRINGGWVVFHAKSRVVRGPHPLSRRPAPPGSSGWSPCSTTAPDWPALRTSPGSLPSRVCLLGLWATLPGSR
eukprot:8028575-Lingulodinium_polyedra.AAC.1